MNQFVSVDNIVEVNLYVAVGVRLGGTWALPPDRFSLDRVSDPASDILEESLVAQKSSFIERYLGVVHEVWRVTSEGRGPVVMRSSILEA